MSHQRSDTSLTVDRSTGSGKSTCENRAADSASYSFPRKSRLTAKADFATVFRKSRRYSDKYWTVLVHRRASPSAARLGLAIAKKRAKRAVDRNRLKRVAREAFRYRQFDLTGLYLVIMNRDPAANTEATILRQSLNQLFNNIIRPR